MAEYLKLGTTSDLYDLNDITTDGKVHIIQGGMRAAQRSGDHWIEVFEMWAKGTHSSIINFEEDIVDHLENGQKYIKNKHRSTPVWIYEYADGETPKRALVRGGSLTPYSEQGINRLLNLSDASRYILEIERGRWEATTEQSGFTTVVFDGTTAGNITQTMTSIKGDMDGRLSALTIRASTTTEAAPLYKAIIGIRPEYASMDNFNPVLNLGYGYTASTDTVLGSTNSNIYPVGTTQSNILKCNFAAYTSDITRASISIEDVWQAEGVSIVINGGAESGNTSGWTSSLTYKKFTASTLAPYTGSWHFRGHVTAANAGAELYQNIYSVTSGNTYHWLARRRVMDYSTISNVLCSLNFTWIYATGGASPNFGGRYEMLSTTEASYQTYEGYSVAPSGTTGAYLSMNLVHGATSNQVSTMYVDDFILEQVYADDYDGEYLVLLRCKVSSGEVDLYGRFGYEGTANRPRFGPTMAVSNTDWMLKPLGIVNIPPERRLYDEEAYWRINKLTFDISARKTSGSPTLSMDAILLVPWEHHFQIENISVAKSSYEIASGEYAYSDLHFYVSPDDQQVVIAEDDSFEGVNTNVTWTSNDWTIPAENCMLVAFAERQTSHQIADDYVVTLSYYPRYDSRNTD